MRRRWVEEVSVVQSCTGTVYEYHSKINVPKLRVPAGTPDAEPMARDSAPVCFQTLHALGPEHLLCY